MAKKKKLNIEFKDLDIKFKAIFIPKLKDGMKETDYIIANFYDTFQNYDWLHDVCNPDEYGYILFVTDYMYNNFHEKQIEEFIDKLNEMLNDFYEES